MERLTFEGNFCDIAMCESTPGGTFCETGSCSQRKVWERLKAYEDTGLTPEQAAGINASLVQLVKTIGDSSLDRLRELAKADKEGRLVVPPCKVGGFLYEADGAHGVITHTVAEIHWVMNTKAVDEEGKEWADYFTDEDISGAHQTREEAEAALKVYEE